MKKLYAVEPWQETMNRAITYQIARLRRQILRYEHLVLYHNCYQNGLIESLADLAWTKTLQKLDQKQFTLSDDEKQGPLTWWRVETIHSVMPDRYPHEAKKIAKELNDKLMELLISNPRLRFINAFWGEAYYTELKNAWDHMHDTNSPYELPMKPKP